MNTLLHKYRLIRQLRELQQQRQHVDRATLQSLAQAFPGALRELELLPPSALKERIALLESGTPDWAEPMQRYHANLRRILQSKRTGSLADLSEHEQQQLSAQPRRRLSELALTWTREQSGLELGALREMLWPLIR